MGRFFPYLGGKTELVPHLLTLIPTHHQYIEVFGGSAELLFAKMRSKQEIYNDINHDLVNLFLQVRDDLDKFVERLNWLPHSREIYEKWSYDFKQGLAPSDPIERAARFYYILCQQFAGKMFGGWAYGKNRKHWTRSRIEKLPSISKRLENTVIECSDFRKVIPVWDGPEAFFYLDPPYMETTGYRQGFSNQDHRDLTEILHTIEGKWLLTYNDHPSIRDAYAEYFIDSLDIQLSSQKVVNNESRKTFSNLIIRNYESGDITQSLLGRYLYSEITESG